MQRLSRVGHSPDAGRIVLRAEDHEVVVHHVLAVDAVAFCNELVLARAGMHQDDVDVAGLAELDRLAGAHGDDVDPAVVGRFEGR